MLGARPSGRGHAGAPRRRTRALAGTARTAAAVAVLRDDYLQRGDYEAVAALDGNTIEAALDFAGIAPDLSDPDTYCEDVRWALERFAAALEAARAAVRAWRDLPRLNGADAHVLEKPSPAWVQIAPRLRAHDTPAITRHAAHGPPRAESPARIR